MPTDAALTVSAVVVTTLPHISVTCRTLQIGLPLWATAENSAIDQEVQLPATTALAALRD
ncbi:hypothetical protein [Streptomyces sp. SID13031]|uniref:hypothetical protein n=1 Tax=Streptomyces sp. SID13031 TaxID=2706046 RepID=UPI001EF347CD|nr:hypothetical protein [Streptomyces sp. SID13031]